MKLSKEARLAYLVSTYWSRKTITVINMARYNKLVKALAAERRINDFQGYIINGRVVKKQND